MIYELLKDTDRFHPVTRSELMHDTGYSDRKVREEIEKLRQQGIRVVNFGEGYFIARTDAEYNLFRKGMMNRIKSISKSVSAMDRNIAGQEKMKWQ